jgi:hypothetical protein
MRWTDDQLIVLLAFYYRTPQPEQTDSHIRCQQFAHAIGRTPGAVDSQLRNVAYDLARHVGDRHVSRKLAALHDLHKDDLPGLYRMANRILRRTGWAYPRF